MKDCYCVKCKKYIPVTVEALKSNQEYICTRCSYLELSVGSVLSIPIRPDGPVMILINQVMNAINISFSELSWFINKNKTVKTYLIAGDKVGFYHSDSISDTYITNPLDVICKLLLFRKSKPSLGVTYPYSEEEHNYLMSLYKDLLDE